jgi:hypothetical protein
LKFLIFFTADDNLLSLAILPTIEQKPMQPILCVLLTFLATLCRLRLSMQLEILALRHQLAVYQRSARRPRLKAGDRLLGSWLSPLWAGWQRVLVFVQPRTVIAWQRRRFRDYWVKLSRGGKPGRPPVSQEVRALIRQLTRIFMTSSPSVTNKPLPLSPVASILPHGAMRFPTDSSALPPWIAYAMPRIGSCSKGIPTAHLARWIHQRK